MSATDPLQDADLPEWAIRAISRIRHAGEAPVRPEKHKRRAVLTWKREKGLTSIE